MKQATFASLAWSNKGKVTKRERFLAEMDAVTPWARLLGLIAPHYPSEGLGRPRKDLELMLRVYFLQQWFNLSDPQAEESLYDSESMISAPSSTKNVSQERDPEMGSTKKGATWHFGMKVHIGTDKRGLTHSLSATSASVNDYTQMPELLHGEERELYGDRSYWSEEHRWLCREAGMRYRVNRRGTRARDLTPAQRRVNRSRSRIRARVEHPFNVVKRLWQFTKVRYRGIAKNANRLFVACALANLYMVRHRLMRMQGA